MLKQILSFAIAFVWINAQAQSFLISTDSTSFPPVHLNEVEVISSKALRNNKIVELPSAVTVLDQKALEDNEVNTLNGISAMIPNLFMPDYGTKLTSPIYLRGVGSRINSPSVGLYVDNVPYFEKAAFDFDFYDIERVEVLRGPQGTLYGRNTMGGIVNIYTKDPGKTRETNLDLSYGNYDYWKGMISHNQPLGEKTSALINASAYNYGGSFTNLYSNSNADAMRSYSGRVKVVSNFSRKLKAMYSMNVEKSMQEGYPYSIYDDDNNVINDVNYDRESLYDRLVFSNNVYLKYMADKFTITSSSSYQFLDGYQDVDQDFSPAKLVGAIQDQEIQLLSQEITLHSNESSNYSYLFGVFAFTQLLDNKVDVHYGEDLIAARNMPNPYVLYKTYDSKTSGAALFHQSTQSDFLIKGLDVVGGIRFDFERASQDYNYDRLVATNLSNVDEFDYQYDYFEILPKIALSYQCSENINTYATISKGYKSGGFNTTIERPEDESFDPEHSINYEVGIKSDFFEGRMTTNMALFYIDWNNQQIYQTVPSGLGSMIKNAGESYSKGLELEFNIEPIKNMNVFSNFGYTEAKFISYEKDSATSYSGNFIPYVPGFTLQTGVNYKLEFNGKFLQNIRMQVSHQSFGKHYWKEDNVAYQDAYGVLNSTISIENKFFTMSFWGKNLLNEEYNSFYFDIASFGNEYVQKGKPIMIGTTLRFKI